MTTVTLSDKIPPRMKKDLHPTSYRPVVIEDISNGTRFITRSTAKTDDATKWEDGKEYPLLKVHISSASHPFYTGQEKLVDVEGRVDRFKARAEAAKERKQKMAKKAVKQAERSKKSSDSSQAKIGDSKYDIKPKKQKDDDKAKSDKKDSDDK